MNERKLKTSERWRKLSNGHYRSSPYLRLKMPASGQYKVTRQGAQLIISPA